MKGLQKSGIVVEGEDRRVNTGVLKSTKKSSIAPKGYRIDREGDIIAKQVTWAD